MNVYTLPRRSYTDTKLLQQRQSNLTPLQTVKWLLTLTNSITHQGIWLKAKHYPCGVCSFSALSWLFKTRWHQTSVWEQKKRGFLGRKKIPPRDHASNTWTYKCCHMHFHKETPGHTHTHKHTHIWAESHIYATQQHSLSSISKWRERQKLSTRGRVESGL